MVAFKNYVRYLSCVFACIMLSSCYVFKAYKSRKFLLKDLPKLEAQPITKSSRPYYFKTDVDNIRYRSLHHLLDTTLENSSTYSFLVIKNDTIIYEKYFNDLKPNDIFPSFSVAKSFVGTLVQIAYQERSIKSLNDPITNYLPYLLKNDSRFSQITIQHLLDMRSGIYSNENYSNPFSDVLKLGFRRNIQAQLNKLKIETAPGTFNYVSVNTQLLGMIVQQATGKKLYTYLQEKIWEPLGMEADATWNIDSRKHDNARAFCCLNATTHDFAKLGRLYLNKGMWNGKRILDSNWVHATTSPDSMYKYDGYRNQWWGVNGYKDFSDSAVALEVLHSNERNKNYLPYPIGQTDKQFRIPYMRDDFFALGILDQIIYVNQENRIIVVRTGRDWNKPEDIDWFIERICNNEPYLERQSVGY
jgi:CubicO group peptidase (beta-lactamase class C family)